MTTWLSSVHECAEGNQMNAYAWWLCSSVREWALRVYDRRAIAVEVVSRMHALRRLHNLPVYEQQVC